MATETEFPEGSELPAEIVPDETAELVQLEALHDKHELSTSRGAETLEGMEVDADTSWIEYEEVNTPEAYETSLDLFMDLFL